MEATEAKIVEEPNIQMKQLPRPSEKYEGKTLFSAVDKRSLVVEKEGKAQVVWKQHEQLTPNRAKTVEERPKVVLREDQELRETQASLQCVKEKRK